MNRIDGGNRTLLLLLGIVLLAAGALALAVGLGAFGDTRAQSAVLSGELIDFVGRNGAWFWPLVAIVALLLAYLGWRWLRGQFSTPKRVDDIDLTRDPKEGFTRAKANGPAHGFAQDVARHPGVESAKARMLSNGSAPQVGLRVEVFENGDIESLREHVEGPALERLRRTLGVEVVTVDLDMRLKEAAGRSLQ
jgi:hypothetical protein